MKESQGVVMGQTSVNIRELKSRLSHYLRLTKAGESVVITERGTPIGRIVPTTAPVEERIEAMAQAGLVLWNRKKLRAMPPVAKVHGKRTVADLLIEDRE
jgi:prevent-host-death family protein